MVHHGTTHIGTTTIIKFPGPVRWSKIHTLFDVQDFSALLEFFKVLFYSGFGVS